MNINQLLIESIEKLKKKKNETPQLDAELLLGFILKKPREYILIHPEYQLTKSQEIKYKKILKRRLKHEPIAYILGQKEFYGLNFKVTKDTLIPRPETELLVELALYSMKHETYNKKNTTIIDIGTGSGNIIISLAKNLNSLCHSRENGNPVANHSVSTLDSRFHGNDKYIFFATDISKKALTVAKHNAKKNRVDEKIKFIKSDLLNCFLKAKSYKLKTNKLTIIANLPYLSKKIYSSTMPDVKNFEPKSALLSGIDGLDHYEKLFKQIKKLEAKSYLPRRQAGKLKAILEISPEQKQKIAKLIRKYFPKATIEFKKDLAQKWRVAIFEI